MGPQHPLFGPRLPNGRPRPPPPDAVPSSSPAFGTAPHPLRPHVPTTDSPTPSPKSSVLPILLGPANLRPLAFRILTKQHSLTLHSSALQVLATFVGKNCGASWKEAGTAEKVLDEAGKGWKAAGGGVILTAEGGGEEMLRGILRGIEGVMSGGKVVAAPRLTRIGSAGGHPARLEREDSVGSFGMSGLDVAEEDAIDEGDPDPRRFLKVVNAFDHPRYTFNTNKKLFEPTTSKPTLLPTAAQKTQLFRQRYALIHQRLLRNPLFQSSSILSGPAVPALTRTDTNTATQSQTYKLTTISALLGRSGTQHVLLGYLSITPTGYLSISDPSGSIILDIRHCSETSPAARYTPGMIVIVQGLYDDANLDARSGNEGASNLGGSSGIGGVIRGHFQANEISQPPAERRAASLGIRDHGGQDEEEDVNGVAPVSLGGFGYFDFAGTGSHRSVGAQMQRSASRVLSATTPQRKRFVILGEVNLDDTLSLAALRKILTTYSTVPDPSVPDAEASLIPLLPTAFVLTGNFTRYPVLSAQGAGSSMSAGSGGSIDYKEAFDTLSAILSDYPLLLAYCAFIFVPGDNDAWASAFSAGAATVIPRRGVPELFTSRIKRAFAAAITETHGPNAGSAKKGEPVWTSNPARLGLFGPVHEVVVFRDEISSRLRRHGLRLNPVATDRPSNPPPEGEEPEPQLTAVEENAISHRPLLTALLSQSTLSPFPPTLRPILWDHVTSLSLYPLPNVLVLVDTGIEPFIDRFEGCLCVNPGSVLGKGGKKTAVVVEVSFAYVGEGERGQMASKGRIRRIRF